MTGRRLLAGLLLLAVWTVAVWTLLASPRLEVEVEMASEVTGRLQLYADDGRGFRSALSDDAPVVGNGQVATYRLALRPRGALRALRLDPADGPGRLEVLAVTVSFDGRRERFTGAEVAAWKAAELRFEEDGWRSLGADPRLVLESEWTPRLAQGPAAWEMALAVAAGAALLALALAPGLGGRTAAALALAAPLLLFAALNAQALGSWWVHDDPCLVAAAGRGIGPHFWDPPTWRALSGSVLMPWTVLSLGLDAALFGLAPAAFYAHQLLAFALLLAVVVALLRSAGLAPWPRALGASLFAASAPAFAVAQQLMNRHYLEGTIFFLAALALYVRAVRTRHAGPALAGAGLYLLAATAKEVFVPLVVVLPLLPVGDVRSRLGRLVPFAVAAALYVPWRLYMLGWANSLSGYAARPPGRVPDVPAIVGLASAWQVAAATLVAALALLGVLKRSRRWLAFGLAAGVVLALPLAPVAGELAPRHFLLPALGAAVLVAAALETWPRERPTARAAVGLALLVFGLHALAGSPIRGRHADAVERHRTEGAFVLGSADGGVLLSRLDDPRYLACVRELRPEAGGPGFCGDVCYCASALPETVLWRDAGGRIAAVAPPRETCAVARELSVEMRYEAARGRLAWRLGPYAEGLYRLLLVTGGEVPEISAPVPITAAGEAPLTLAEPFRSIVCYRSPERWHTYSPVLTLDPAAGRLRWQR